MPTRYFNDGRGATLELEEVDGVLYPRYHDHLEQQLQCIRQLHLCDDDVILCTYPKAGRRFSPLLSKEKSTGCNNAKVLRQDTAASLVFVMGWIVTTVKYLVSAPPPLPSLKHKILRKVGGGRLLGILPFVQSIIQPLKVQVNTKRLEFKQKFYLFQF